LNKSALKASVVLQETGASKIELSDSSQLPSPSNWKSRLKGRIKKFPLITDFLKLTLNIPRFLKSFPRTLFNEIKFLRCSYQILGDINVICVGGSGTLQDLWGGPWGHPYTLFKWSLMAKKKGCKFNFLSCGTIPFTTYFGRFFIKHSIKMAHYVSVRDEKSKDLLESIGANAKIYVMPDIAHSHPAVASRAKLLKESNRKKLRVGINPTPIYGKEYETPEGKIAYQKYIDFMAKFLIFLTENYCEPVYYANHPRDEAVLKDMMQRAHLPGEVAVFCEIAPLQEYIYELDLAVASRFHGIVFPLAQCIPTISLSKDSKQVELMKNYNLLQYSIMIDDCTTEKLIGCFKDLLANRIEINQHLRQVKKTYLTQLEKQYEKIF
jgi:polysaccharide pyruvyl transferase WcaK-like protein